MPLRIGRAPLRYSLGKTGQSAQGAGGPGPRIIRLLRKEGLARVHTMGYGLCPMSTFSQLSRKVLGIAATSLFCTFVAGCAGTAPNQQANWPPLVKKWYDRAAASLKVGDMQDAQLSAENALRLDPQRQEVKLLAAKVALSQLEFDRVIQLTEAMPDPESMGVRGRAFWYAGRVQDAAETLERLVANPDVHDSWAVDIAKLARRGVGRKPFTTSGGLVAVADMPRVGRSLLTPVEVDGEPALGMIATGVAETIIDASGGTEPKWISLRFGEHIEVKDVPALAKDLSSLSRQLNAPVKIMLGVNLLRHLHPTIDLLGSQFVVRTYEPPPPPVATTVALSYVRGGGMLVRGGFGSGSAAIPGSFIIDTSMDFPLALDAGGWKKAGKNLSDLQAVPGNRGMSQGLVPVFDFGTLEIPDVPALSGVPIQEIEKPVEMDLDGIIGAGLLAPFRVTLADNGRAMWLEPMPVDPSLLPPQGHGANATESGPPQEATPQSAGAGRPTVPASKPSGSGASPQNSSVNAPLSH
jgi:hypothetical protein